MSITRYLTFPFRVALSGSDWPKIGGLESVLIAELDASRLADSDLAVMCEGPIDPSAPDRQGRFRLLYPSRTLGSRTGKALLEFWFDEMWAYLHPAAFTERSLSPDLIQLLYHGTYHRRPGSLEQMFDHFQQYGVLSREPHILATQALRYEPLLKVDAGSLICWTDFFWKECMIRNSARLRDAGVGQKYISHVFHPDRLDEAPQGRLLIRAMSEADDVYFHTDRFARSFEAQIERLGYRMPKVRRFDLGVDRGMMTEGALAAPYASSLSWDAEQRELVAEVFATSSVVAHRFLCLDRIDPIKGNHIVLRAVEKHLSGLELAPEAIRKQYRFFFLMHYLRRARGMRADCPSNRYIEYIRSEEIPRLCQKFPGVFWFSENIPDRRLIGALLRDVHVLSGGVQEGLGIAVQEGVFVNARIGAGRTIIVGDGTGFAIQTIDDGFGALAEFPQSGCVDAFATSIGRVVAADPEVLRARTRDLAERVVNKRAASVMSAVGSKGLRQSRTNWRNTDWKE